METLSVLISMLISNSSYTILKRKNGPTYFPVSHSKVYFPVKYEVEGINGKWEVFGQVK